MDYAEQREILRQRRINEEAAAKRLALTRMIRSYKLNETMAGMAYPDIWRHIANDEKLVEVRTRFLCFNSWNFEFLHVRVLSDLNLGLLMIVML